MAVLVMLVLVVFVGGFDGIGGVVVGGGGDGDGNGRWW